MEYLKQALTITAGKIGLNFQKPDVIIDTLLKELECSPGTLYAWLNTDRCLVYLRKHYGETIWMFRE
jgi:hypothetical protein